MHFVILDSRPAVNEEVKPVYLNDSMSKVAEVYLLGFRGRAANFKGGITKCLTK